MLGLFACNNQATSARIVVGTWSVTAAGSPGGSPGGSAAGGPGSPITLATPGRFGSPIASPGTPLASPVGNNHVSAVLARDVGPDGAPVDPSNTFPADSAKIFLVYRTTGLKPDSHLEAVWVAVDVRAPLPKDYEVTRATNTVGTSPTGSFSVSKPPAGFPAGQYRVDLFLDGTLVGTFPFTVQ